MTSGVLNRMVQRAQGGLPSVQPLATPRAEGPAFGEREARSGMALRETELVTQDMPGVRRDRVRAEAGRDAQPERDDSAKTSANPWTRAWAGELEIPGGRLSPRQLGGSTAERDVELEEANANEDRGSRLLEVWAEERVKPQLIERAGEPESPGQEPMKRLDEPDRAGMVVRSDEVASPAAEERTEIHISIGSVELRAPRMEAKPRPAAFKPRVTLEEFLRRRDGARR
jgi:hypothetical protein